MKLASSLIALVAALAASSPVLAVDLPYLSCTATGCHLVRTSLILLEGSTNFTGAEVYQNGPRGFRMNAPISRSYVVNEEGTGYEQFYLKNRELAIDVNVAGVECGYNAAFYFSAMDTSAPLGYGYCDAQNTCNEMDIVEANSGSQQVAVHACNATSGACDPWGCAVNSYASNLTHQLGPGGYIDTTKTFTVITAFYTDTGDDYGTMNKVVQSFKQGSKTFSFPAMDEASCTGGRYWNTTGEFGDFSKAWDGGMTMIFSFWGQGPPDGMSWLDGGVGTNPACDHAVGPNHAIFSNIVVRPISPSMRRRRR